MDGTSQFCSMSTVKRWAFTICDCCCEKFGIKMINGIHYPKKVTILSEDTESLTDHLNKLALQDAIGIKSMTGVSWMLIYFKIKESLILKIRKSKGDIKWY